MGSNSHNNMALEDSFNKVIALGDPFNSCKNDTIVKLMHLAKSRQNLLEETIENLSQILVLDANSENSRFALCAITYAVQNKQKLSQKTINNLLEVLLQTSLLKTYNSINIGERINYILNLCKSYTKEYILPKFISVSFDKRFVHEMLNCVSAANITLHLLIKEDLKKLIHIARRHGMTPAILTNITKELLNEMVDHPTKLVFAQTLKYSMRKDSNCSGLTIPDFINILKNNTNLNVLSEIVWSLGYVMRNSLYKTLTQDIEEEIKHNIQQVNPAAKHFLMQQIENQQRNDNEIVITSCDKIKVPTNYVRKPPQAYVTKTQQVTINHKICSQSEETKIIAISLAEALRNRNKKIGASFNAENLPTIETDDKKGDDRTWYEATYKTVKRLYGLAKIKDYKLKKGDKDDYLIEKFIDNKPKYFGNPLKNFIIDRMIAATFLTISAKQELTNEAINKLMICLDKIAVVKSRIFDNKSDKKIACIIFNSSLPEKDLNDIEEIIIDKISKIKETYKTHHNKETEIIEEFSSEINQIRLNSIASIYNCVSLSRGKFLTKQLLEKIDKCLEDNDTKFKAVVTKILRYAESINSESIGYSRLFTGYLEQLEGNIEIEEAIQYINFQTKDKKRCAELFKENTLLRISKIINNDDFDNDARINCCEIINNYLEHDDKGLSENVLKSYIQVFENAKSGPELKAEVLRSILINIEKSKNLPNFVVQTLISNIENFDQKSVNFTIVVLGNICEKIQISNLGKIAYKLLDNSIIVKEGTEITFENSIKNKKNIFQTSICSIVGKIFLTSVQQGARLDEKSLENLIKCVDGKDKQARILAAKTLYFASLKQELNNDLLIRFRDYVNDNIVDVRTYLTAAYANGLNNLPEDKAKSHFEFLPQIYAFEDLVLGEENFTDKVNENILFFLLKEASKDQEFDNNVFIILDYILFYGSQGQDDAINILNKYTQNKKHLVPENTILAIENAYGISHISNEALNVLKIVIKNGQPVSNNILKVFTDDFFFSDIAKVHDESFDLLDIANQNQDISDEVFNVLEMERAGKVIDERKDYDNDKEKEGAFEYLTESVRNGKKLSVSNFKILNQLKILIYKAKDKQSTVPNAVAILMYAAKHKQIIPYYLVDTLVSEFNAGKNQSSLLCIFSSLLKNNQKIPDNFFKSLEKTLEVGSEIYDQVLLIFVFQGQKGEKLSPNIINKIFDEFLNGKQNINLQHEYLSSIISIIENNEGFNKELASQILLKGVLSDNGHFVKEAVKAIKILSFKDHLDNNLLKCLVNKATSCDEEVKDNILSILENAKLQKNEQNKLILLRLSNLSGSLALDEMIKLTSNGNKLLKTNFVQINTIIEKSPELQNKALKVLLLTPNKKDIIDELLHNISVLSINTNSEEFKDSYHLLIKQIVREKKTITPKITSALYKLMTESNEKKLISFWETFSLIAENQEIPSYIGLLLLDIDNLLLKRNPQKVNQLFERIQKELLEGTKLPSQVIDKLVITCKDCGEDLDLIESFANIFSSLLIQGQKLSNENILHIIEKAIVTKKVNKNIIDGCKHLIKLKHYQDLTAILNTFSDLIKDNSSYEIKIAILECINQATQVTDQIPNNTILILEKSLESLEPNIKKLSFQSLRKINRAGYESSVFKNWCKINLNNLIESGLAIENKLDEENLELLDTLSLLNYVNLECLNKNAEHRQKWHRDLLISDLLARFDKLGIDKRFNFYKSWFELKSLPEYHDKRADTTLKLILYAQNKYKCAFNQVFEALDALKQISFENAIGILSDAGNNWQLKLKQQWLINLIAAKSKTQQTSMEYIISTVARLTPKNLSLITTYLNKVKVIESLSVLDSLIEFICHHKVKKSFSPEQVNTIHDLYKLLEIQVLSSKFYKQAKSLQLEKTIDNLFIKKWSFEQLNLLISKLGDSNTINQEKLENLNQVFEIIDQYNVPLTTHSKILSILDQETKTWVKEVNLIAVENNFQVVGKIKNLSELIRELGDKNANNLDILKLIEDKLDEKIEEVKNPGLKSKILKSSDEIELHKEIPIISEWNKDYIKLWAKKVKLDNKCFKESYFITEVLAVIKRAYLLTREFHLSDSQILSCFVALHKKHNQGRLLQVSTGEGKSTMVSMLAIVYALKGKKVDIITSSPVLAERDAKENAKLYNMFDLSTDCNSDKSIYIKGAKDCYEKDVVYGDTAQFQFDTLREEYSCLGALSTRKCEVAIVDEVDSMLIDDSSKIARLANTMAGMDQLQPIYHFLWQRLNSLQDRLININGKEYLAYGKVKYNQNVIVLEYADDKGNIFQISDLKKHIESGNSLNALCEEIKGDSNIFLKQYLQDYLTALTSDKDISFENISRFDIKPEGKIQIPNNFKEFVETQISKWAENAIEAFNYQERVHYVVHEGMIKPVDYNSTGVVQNSTNWSDGLHQFLQIKHNLKMTSETLTTNFLSNIGYFKRYQNNLIGLTGTLGSIKAREVLSNVYFVDLVYIPRLHQKQYIQLPDINTLNHEQWLYEIINSAIHEVNKCRGALIICNTIEHAQIISQNLKKRYRAEAIKLYDMNDMNQEKEIEKVCSGEIIVATNLAGRGTDIKTDDIEEKGGLHVILTFMPSNQRVEEQAFGRTSRQGKRGTGQMILNIQNIAHNSKEARDKDETESFEKFTKSELKTIEIKDMLFKKFCAFLCKIRAEIRKKKSSLTKTWEIIKDQFVNVMPSVYEFSILSAIEEQWGMFLRKIDDGTIKIEHAKSEYKHFVEQLNSGYKSETIIKNPYYHIVIANDFILNNSAEYEEANKHFEKAIELDKNFSCAAFVGKALYFLKKHKDLDNYKQKSIESLNVALHILGNEMGMLNLIQTLLHHQTSNIHSDLSKQLIQKTSLLCSYINSIEMAISVIKKSQRLIDVKVINKNQIISYFELERDKNSHMIQKFSELANYDHFEVTFNDLTVRNDSGAIDQAVETISIAFKDYKTLPHNILKKVKLIQSSILKKSYKNVHITMKNINAEKLRALLNPNIEIIETTKEVAINYLKKESSFIERCLSSQSKVNLTIVGKNKQTNVRNELPIAQAVNIIKKKSNEYRFTLSFVNTGETSEEVTKTIAIKKLEKKKKLCSKTLVNLYITAEDRTNLEFKNISVKEAIDLVEKKDDKCRFSIDFINANKTADFIQKSKIGFDIEFLQITSKSAQEKIENTEFEVVTVEIQGTPEDLLKAVKSSTKDVQLLFAKEEGSFSITLKANIALEKIQEEKIEFIKIEKLTKEEAQNVFKLCPESKFNINLVSVNQKSAVNALKYFEGECYARATFKNLGHFNASKFIPKIREANQDFSLIFKNLNRLQFEQLIQKASIKQEDIEITKFKTLGELFLEENRPVLELQEFAARGIEILIEIFEKGFIPWMSISIVSAIAAVQMLVGTALVASGWSATVGIGLITEGFADLHTVYKAYSTRQFSWKAYGTQKAISLAVSAVSMGWGAIKNAGKGTVVLAEGIGSEVVEQATTQAITNFKTVGETVIQTGKNLKSLAFKQMAVTAGISAIKKGSNIVASSLIDLALERFKPEISKYIQAKVQTKFCELLLKMVSKMYAIDNLIKHANLREKINIVLAGIVNLMNNDTSRNLILKIGSSIYSLLYNVNSALVGCIFSTLDGIAQLVTIINMVFDYLIKEIAHLDKEYFSISHLIQQHCEVSISEASEIYGLLKTQGVIGNDDNLNPLAFKSISTFQETTQFYNPDSSMFTSQETFEYQDLTKIVIQIDNIDLIQYNHHKNDIISLIKLLFQKTSSFEISDFSIIMKSISDVITNQVVKIAESQLLSPWSNIVIDELASTLSTKIQSVVEKNQLDCEIKSVEEKENKISEDLKIKQDLKANLAKNKSLNTTENTVAKVKEYAQKVKDGKPVDFTELYIMAAENCVNIKIVDNPNYQLTEKNMNKNAKICNVVFKGNENSPNYYQLIDANGQCLSQCSDGYTIFTSLTGKSVEQLRNETAHAIENNPGNFIKSIKAQKWVQKKF
ncbi:uncharacterized protein LOC124809060 [Hydra vulgaris]|uniref:uncharacterized protein LOC124809060 n=1 Tax=Hydra vulgaris TaxID=6087 RepID=UPI001F5EC1B9|nr:uncharacterized protein LOC124809060 [Hydra vulgaris]